MRSLCSVVFIFIFFALSLTAQTDWDFGGDLDILYGGFLREPQAVSASEVRFSPLWEGYGGPLFIKAELQGEYDLLVPEDSHVTLGDVFLEYSGASFDIRAGRQVISWGKADGIQITDILCPRDYRGDVQPVSGIKLRQFGISYTAEAVWIPLFSPSELPEDENDPYYSLYFPGEADHEVDEGNRPDKLSESEWAAHLSFFLPFMDLSFSCFSGWEDDAVFISELDGSMVRLTPEYYRIIMGGVDMAVPVRAILLRGEGALIGGERFEYSNGSGYGEETQILVLAGLDWNPSGGWTLTAQYYEDIILSSNDTYTRNLREPACTLNVSKTLFCEIVTVTLSSMVHLVDGDSASSFETEWDISDGFHGTLGCDLYLPGPTGDGAFGSMEEISALWIRGSISF